MHPVIQQIKDECWDGQDRHPKGKICNFHHDNDMLSVKGIQRQIDSSLSDVSIIFVMNKDMKIQRYFFQKESENK
jgi:hypothetical protein